MTIVLLVRHGRTGANRAGILAGRAPGVTLDALGRRQARSLGSRLRDVPIDVIAHSPLERCAQTAQLLLDVRRTGAQPRLVADDGLVECDYGQWTGRPLRDLARDPMWARVQEDPGSVVFPGGESMAAMAARTVTAVRDWAQRVPEGVIVVVSHGDPLKAVLSDALAQPFAQFQRIVVSPGSVSLLALGPGRPAVLGMNLTGGRLRLPRNAPVATLGGGAQ